MGNGQRYNAIRIERLPSSFRNLQKENDHPSSGIHIKRLSVSLQIGNFVSWIIPIVLSNWHCRSQIHKNSFLLLVSYFWSNTFYLRLLKYSRDKTHIFIRLSITHTHMQRKVVQLLSTMTNYEPSILPLTKFKIMCLALHVWFSRCHKRKKNKTSVRSKIFKLSLLTASDRFR